MWGSGGSQVRPNELGGILERLVSSGTGPIREVALIFSDQESRSEMENSASVALSKVPGLQKLVIESPHSSVEVPVQTTNVSAFLSSKRFRF